MAVWRCHLLKTGMIHDKVGSKHIEQGIQVFAFQLNRLAAENSTASALSQKYAHGMMLEGLRVPDVVGLVHDDQIEFRRRVQAQQTLILDLASSASPKYEIGIKERERQDGFGILLGPRALQMRLLQAMTKQPAIESREVFVKAPSPRPTCLAPRVPWGR